MVQVCYTGCSQDCYDNCGVEAHVENGRLVALRGNTAHRENGGWLCAKGRSYIERVYHPDRLLYPLRRVNGDWRRITWKEAYQEIADKLNRIIAKDGPLAVMHYNDAGSVGALKSLDRRFFNALGGVTVPAGSLCWSAGIAAQQYDFGANRAHTPADIENSRLILIWGRDVEKTNQHFLPFLKRAADRGAKAVVINPLPLALPFSPSMVLTPRPGTDGALALAVAHVLIRNGLLDREFIENHTIGFAQFAELAADKTPAWAERETGVPALAIENLAQLYGSVKPAAILLGWGLQRHQNGGQTVRAIDALAALTGNLGIPGGGANYANKGPGFNPALSGDHLAKYRRTFARVRFAEEVARLNDPPIRVIFVNRANPITQLPDTNRVLATFRNIEFKVVIDQFLTDTAKEADLVLPCTTYLEETNLYKNSWHNSIILGEKVIEPLGETKSDQQIFTELAHRMGLGEHFNRTEEEWLEYALKPLQKHGVTLEKLRLGPVCPEGMDDVPWRDRVFATPSGKYEFYSEKAKVAGLPPLPEYRPVRQDNPEHYPFYLITPHSKFRINSQFTNIPSVRRMNPEPRLDIHPETATDKGIKDGDWVKLTSPRGEVTVKARLQEGIRPDTVALEEGWWCQDGVMVNVLTPSDISDMGLCSTLYDCRVQIEKKCQGDGSFDITSAPLS